MAVTIQRPAGWVITLAVGGVAVTVATIVGPPLAQRIAGVFRSYVELSADELTRTQQHFYDLADVAYYAARNPSLVGLERGRVAADELAQLWQSVPAWDHARGNAIHFLNIIKGRLALSAGDIEAAKYHLLEAGKTPGSPQLDDYGPDMTLAQEMLARGESTTVLRYFEECDKFWARREKNKLAEWSSAVRAGQMPDFGANSGLTPRERLR